MVEEAAVVEFPTPQTAARKAADAFIATNPVPGVVVEYAQLFEWGELEPLSECAKYTPKEVREWGYFRWAFMDSFRDLIGCELQRGMETVIGVGLRLLGPDDTVIHGIGVSYAAVFKALRVGAKIVSIPDEGSVSSPVLKRKRNFLNSTAAIKALAGRTHS